METTTQRPSLLDRLNDPHTAEMLHRLLDHAEMLDQTLTAAKELPNLLAIAVDFFDAMMARAARNGIDAEQRLAQLTQQLVQLTEPQAMRAIEALVGRLPQLAEASALLEELPNLVAIATDVFDEWAQRLKKDGIDLEESVRRGLHAALYLGAHVREEELERIGFILRSDVMSQSAVETVGLAGTALSSCRRGTCDQPVPPRVGWLGVVRAMSDPNTQRALSFGLQFAKCFGNALDESHPGATSQRNGK
jgi:hypothetical protein